ncbi:hypothetical protein [Oceanicaulis sp.]|uniref:hypothetical protein n=1 Tax=Oceanicaulis sp. TaxID=1924941 RepID=UPI003F6EB23A
MNEIATPHRETDADLEILAPAERPSSMAVQLQRAEIDQQITTARAYPRSLSRVKQAIMNMATLDEESAAECMYALPRGGKPIKGPSVRFAEILKQAYGNCRAAARVVHVDREEKYVEAEGVFHDLETNSATTTRVRRRISDKNGRLFSEDMIVVTGNAACAIAKRNAILDGIPRPLWRRAYETVEYAIAGDITTLAENREKAIKALATYGATPEQVCAALGHEGPDDVTLDDIITLRGMYSALKNGEATPEEVFNGQKAADRGSIRERFRKPAAKRVQQQDETAQPEPQGKDERPARDINEDSGEGAAASAAAPEEGAVETPAEQPDDPAPSSDDDDAPFPGDA